MIRVDLKVIWEISGKGHGCRLEGPLTVVHDAVAVGDGQPVGEQVNRRSTARVHLIFSV